MKLADPRLLLALVSLGLVLWLGYLSLGGFDAGQASPGPLTSVHAREPALAGSAGCTACHGARGATMAEACTACHAAIGEQLAGGHGLHGSLGAEAARCSLCHVEHHGDALPLVSERAFALAGYEELASFDHPGIQFALAGRHAELACADCHESADLELLPPGEQRFLGLEQRCTACHADPHGGRMVRSCEACHGQEEPFERAAAFEHDAAFPLSGAHAGLACGDCHARGSAHDFELLAGPGPHPPARDCGACHASPHTEPFLAAVAGHQGVPAGATCGACHPALPGGFGPALSELTPELHALSGFALEPPHAGLACHRCHVPDTTALALWLELQDEPPPDPRFPAYSQRFPGRAADDCAACHADPHRGQFESSTFLASQPTQGCLACHDRARFAPPVFGLEQHARTAFPLEASHVRAACHDCHLMPLEAPLPRIFHGTPASCAECHSDPHAGSFVRRPGAQDCAACHLPTTFADVERSAFEHALWTGFELEGAHAAAACEACHARAPEPDGLGRAFGRAAELFGQPVDRCSTCHADAHAGAFDAPGLPRVVHGREDCARCHAPTSFADVERSAFEHALWTGFELHGNHGRAACEACHVPSLERDEHGRRFGHALGRACLDCHVDPHAGQFAARGRGGCADCHPPAAASFRALAFDHDRTRFPLIGAHARAACERCHVPSPTAGGGLAVRYRPLGTRCQDCHQSRVRLEDLLDRGDDGGGGGEGRGRGRGRGGDGR